MIMHTAACRMSFSRRLGQAKYADMQLTCENMTAMSNRDVPKSNILLAVDLILPVAAFLIRIYCLTQAIFTDMFQSTPVFTGVRHINVLNTL